MTQQTLISIELPLGTHHFAAEIISAKCTADGIRNELIPTSSLNLYSMLDGDTHRLLVNESDMAAVQAIIANTQAATPAPARRHSRPQRIAALSLSALVLGPVIVAAIDWIIKAI